MNDRTVLPYPKRIGPARSLVEDDNARLRKALDDIANADDSTTVRLLKIRARAAISVTPEQLAEEP